MHQLPVQLCPLINIFFYYQKPPNHHIYSVCFLLWFDASYSKMFIHIFQIPVIINEICRLSSSMVPRRLCYLLSTRLMLSPVFHRRIWMNGQRNRVKLMFTLPLQHLHSLNIKTFIWKSHKILTHRGRDKIASISQTTFSNVFSWMNVYEFRLRFHRNFFLRFELTILQNWFR